MKDRYKTFIHTTMVKYGEKSINPGYFAANVWESEESVAVSQRAKRNRTSDSGIGSMHTAGSISVAEHHCRMRNVYGDGVTFSDAHPPQWVDSRAEATFNNCRRNVGVEVLEGRLNVEGDKVPWCPKIWKDVATHGRKKRRERVYGFGDYGAAAILPASSCDASHYSPSTSQSQVAINTTNNEIVRRVLEENARIIADNERIRVENERAKVENERLQAMLLEFTENYQHGATLPPPSSQARTGSSNGKGHLSGPLDLRGLLVVTASQDAVVDSLVHILKTATPLCQDFSNSKLSQVPKPKIVSKSIQEPEENTNPKEDAVQNPAFEFGTAASGLLLLRTTSEALEELQGYKDMKEKFAESR